MLSLAIIIIFKYHLANRSSGWDVKIVQLRGKVLSMFPNISLMNMQAIRTFTWMTYQVVVCLNLDSKHTLSMSSNPISPTQRPIIKENTG